MKLILFKNNPITHWEIECPDIPEEAKEWFADEMIKIYYQFTQSRIYWFYEDNRIKESV